MISIKIHVFHSKNTKDEIKSVIGGYLTQEKNNIKIKKSDLKCVSNKKARLKNLHDLVFAFKICKHVKSNAIVLVNNKQTVGIGAGQMSRIDSTKLALMKYKDNFAIKKFKLSIRNKFYFKMKFVLIFTSTKFQKYII